MEWALGRGWLLPQLLVTHILNSSIQEAEPGSSLRVSGQPGPHSELHTSQHYIVGSCPPQKKREKEKETLHMKPRTTPST